MRPLKIIPKPSLIPGYNIRLFKNDLFAGITVWVMLVPQGMAYAMIAGLPPIYGLYASAVPMIIYALVGTSKQLSVGPVAMDAILIAGGLATIGVGGVEDYIILAVLLALMVGVLQALLGIMRLGFLVNFLSYPVVSGFTSAAAVIIGLNQLKYLLGIATPRSTQIHELLVATYHYIGGSNVFTILTGTGGILIVLFFKRYFKKIPGSLIAVAASILASYAFGLDNLGVAIVGAVPSGLPSFAVPSFDLSQLKALSPIAMTLSLVGFMEAVAVAKAVPSPHKEHRSNPNRELIALGLSNIGGSFFSSFPTTASFSRSAVNKATGGTTGISPIISALLVILTLVFMTPLFFHLPHAVLASVIIPAVFGLIDFKEVKLLWKTDRRDLAMLLITFFLTLFMGIQSGILAGVFFSVVLVIYKSSYPHYAVLGKVERGNTFRNIKRFPDAQQIKGVLIIRFDAQLFFANAHILEEIITEEVMKREGLRLTIINAEAINSLDSSSIKVLKSIHKKLITKGIKLIFVGVKGPVRDIMTKNEMLAEFGKESFFDHLQGALSAFDGEKITADTFEFQSNLKK